MGSLKDQAIVDIGVNDADKLRNRRMGAGLVNDPYPLYDELRENCGVHRGELMSLFGLESAPGFSGEGETYVAVSFDAVEEIMRSPHIYSSSWYTPMLRASVGYSILEMDEPDHRRHRGLIQPAFKRRVVEEWQEKWLQPKIDELVDKINSQKAADLFTELCALVPVHTIVSAFGISTENVEEFHQDVIVATSTGSAPEDQFAAIQRVAAHLKAVIAKRRVEPQDDLLSMLASKEFEDVDGSRHVLDDEEILAFARLMLPAGAGTTYRGLGTLLLALLSNPDQFEALKQDRSLLDAAIEEALRWEQPLGVLGRIVTQDTELCGLNIKQGSMIQICISAANSDPSRWASPREFNIFRPKKSHISFGSGPHTCIGIHLARMEMRAVMTAILDKLPNINLDKEAPQPFMTGLTFRLPTAVPVVINGQR